MTCYGGLDGNEGPVDELELVELVEVENAHGRGNRDIGGIVDVETEELTFGLHDPDDPKTSSPDANESPEGVVVREELTLELGAEHRHRPRTPRVPGRPERARSDVKLPHAGNVRRHTADEHASSKLARLDARLPHRERHDLLDTR